MTTPAATAARALAREQLGDRIMDSLCEGCPATDCERCPVTRSTDRYVNRKRQENRIGLAIGAAVFVVVLFFGMLLWAVWSTHTLVAQHSRDLSVTTALTKEVLKLESSAGANHTDTLGELKLIQSDLVLLCQSTPGCKLPPKGTP